MIHRCSRSFRRSSICLPRSTIGPIHRDWMPTPILPSSLRTLRRAGSSRCAGENLPHLQTREARGRLKTQGKPHYRTLEEGLHLGYRKPQSGAGKWVARFYDGGQAYTVETIAIADDLSDANATTVLSFDQAQKKAREIRDQRDRAKVGKTTGPFTVADAMDLYIEFLESDDRTPDALDDTRYRDAVHIRPVLGRMPAPS